MTIRPTPLLELTDPLLEGLLGHPTVPKLVSGFQVLQAAKDKLAAEKAAKKCQRCINTAKRGISQAMLSLKQQILRLPADQKLKLKLELRTEKVRITITDSRGRRHTASF